MLGNLVVVLAELINDEQLAVRGDERTRVLDSGLDSLIIDDVIQDIEYRDHIEWLDCAQYPRQGLRNICMNKPIVGVNTGEVLNGSRRDVHADVIPHTARLPKPRVKPAAAANIKDTDLFQWFVDMACEHRLQRIDSASVYLTIVGGPHRSMTNHGKIGIGTDTLLPIATSIKIVAVA